MQKNEFDDVLNNQVRKFLKKVGINSHQIINQKFDDGKKSISVVMKLEIDGNKSDEFKVEIKV